MNGPATRVVTFDLRRLSQAPAAAATLRAGEDGRKEVDE